MKTAHLPAIRVSPELREAAERVLRPEETLSRLIEESLRSQIAYRLSEDEFIARGLHSAQESRAQGSYHSATQVVGELKQRLARAHQAKGRTAKPLSRSRS